MKVNYKQLHQDIKFPLSWCDEDYKTFIFDADMNMVAQVESKRIKDVVHPFEKLIGECKEIDEPVKGFYKLVYGDFINPLTMEIIGCVRGWGRLSQLNSPSGEKRQDNIANYILNILNT